MEAKALEKDLNERKWISQNLSYATVVGVEWCALTNGDEYRLYNAHAAVDVDEKLFRTVKISDDSREHDTLETLELLSKEKMGENLLSVLWKAHFIDRNVRRALDDLLGNEDGGLIRLIRKKTAGLSPSEIRSSLKRARISIDFPVVAGAGRPAATATNPALKRPKKQKKSPAMLGVKVTDLISAGLANPPLDLERKYRGTHLRATLLEDGTVQFGNERYDSLSTGAGMARASVVGARPGRRYPQTNGWIFWQYREPGTGKLREIDYLRRRYLASSGRT